MAMANIRGGSYAIGALDGTVQLKRHTGLDGTGECVISITMPPNEARMIGRALLEQADAIDLVGPLDEYRGQ